MLSIHRKSDFDSLQVLYTLPGVTDIFKSISSLFNGGIFLEYWEDSAINFKFHVFDGIVSIYSGLMSDLYTSDEFQVFFNSVIKLSDLYDWVHSNVTIELIDSVSRDSPKLSKIYKFRGDLDIPEELFREEIDGKCLRFRLQNSVDIQLFPYEWGSYCKYRFSEVMCPSERYYYSRLCIIKLYVEREYKNRDNECK